MTTPEHQSPTSPSPDPSLPPPPPPPGYGQQDQPQQGYGQQGQTHSGPAMPAPPPWAQYSSPSGALGTMRPTGLIILLFFVTLGIWGFVYYFQTHEEMRRHTGDGLGGIIALLIAVIFGIVSPFLHSFEVGKLYERRGQAPPVTALTGLWVFPGIFILVGPFIWFVRSNNALNEYWRSQGVTRTSVV